MNMNEKFDVIGNEEAIFEPDLVMKVEIEETCLEADPLGETSCLYSDWSQTKSDCDKQLQSVNMESDVPQTIVDGEPFEPTTEFDSNKDPFPEPHFLEGLTFFNVARSQSQDDNKITHAGTSICDAQELAIRKNKTIQKAMSKITAMESRLRATPEQFAALIEFMESNGDISRPLQGAQSRLRADRLWQGLTSLLNSLEGGVQKTPDKWKKVWVDWKSKTKKKALDMMKLAEGNGPTIGKSLTVTETRVLAIIGESPVPGQPLPEHEFNKPSQTGNHHSETVLQVNGILVPAVQLSLTPQIPSSPPRQLVLAPMPSSQPPSDRLFTTLLQRSPTPPQRPPTPQPQRPPPSPSVPRSRSPLPPHPLSPMLQCRRSPLPQLRPKTADDSKRWRQASVSPRPAIATSRRGLTLRAPRSHGLTPISQMNREWLALEQRRLTLEEARDKRMHELEMKRLELESQRLTVAQEHNQLLQQLGVIGQSLLDVLSQQRLPS